MADGIDSFSHHGAVDGGGFTIAVLGCGVDIVYPKENYNLYNKILESGMIISEYPISTPPERFRFPERNKLIAALSDATLVVQAKEKSGSLITADLALKYNKKLFALPGNISSQSPSKHITIFFLSERQVHIYFLTLSLLPLKSTTFFSGA